MKTVKIISITLILLLAPALFTNCEKEENKPIENAMWTLLEDEEFQIVGAANSGEIMAIKVNSNSFPTEIFYQNKDNPGFYLWLTEYGLPKKAYINGNYIFYENITENSADIGIVAQDGSSEIIRNIEYDFSEIFGLTNQKCLQPSFSWGNAVKWSGHALNAGMCIASLAGTATSFGILAPVAALTCTSFIVGMTMEAVDYFVDNQAVEDAMLVTKALTIHSIGDVLVVVGKLMHRAEEDKQNNQVSIAKVEDKLVNFIDNVPEDVNNFLTPDLVTILEDNGLTIHKGLNPPNATGNYYVDDWTNKATGNQYINYSYKFSNQTTDYKIEIDRHSVASTAYGLGAFISGNGSDFSIYCEMDSEITDGDHTVYVKSADIYSGTITSNGIMDFEKGFIIVEKENDTNDNYMDVGDSRVIYEADGLAEKVFSYPYNPSLKSTHRPSDFLK